MGSVSVASHSYLFFDITIIGTIKLSRYFNEGLN